MNTKKFLLYTVLISILAAATVVAVVVVIVVALTHYFPALRFPVKKPYLLPGVNTLFSCK